MSDRIYGFQPVFNANSELLILGSFPSVKSRAVDFYYGNRQNRFWKMLFGYFGEEVSKARICPSPPCGAVGRRFRMRDRRFFRREYHGLCRRRNSRRFKGGSDPTHSAERCGRLQNFLRKFCGDRGAVSVHAVHQSRESSLRSGRLVCRSRLGFWRGKIEELRRGKWGIFSPQK